MIHECKNEIRIANIEREAAVNNANTLNLIRTMSELSDEIKELRLLFKDYGRWIITITSSFVSLLIGVLFFLIKSKLGW